MYTNVHIGKEDYSFVSGPQTCVICSHNFYEALLFLHLSSLLDHWVLEGGNFTLHLFFPKTLFLKLWCGGYSLCAKVFSKGGVPLYANILETQHFILKCFDVFKRPSVLFIGMLR